jgi:hypothetical protein
MNAREIIQDALEWLNRLSPGETLDADTAAFCMRRLNTLVDERSAEALFLYQDLKTTASQTGHITLGAGSWAAIPVGAEIIAMGASDGYGLLPMPLTEYITLADPTTSGDATTYTYDHKATIYLYPVPTSQTLTIQTRAGVTAFADLDTEYTATPGTKASLGVSLAIRCAPTLLGSVPAPLVRAEKRATMAIQRPMPAVLHNDGFQSEYGASRILTGP